MSVSLIISIYRSQKDLPLLLSALAQQSRMPDEIIFAEDDINAETIELLKLGKKLYPQLRMRLIQHEDRGFRKAEIVNKAVAIAKHENLIFLDGDCLPHRHYVRSYADVLKDGVLLNARPVYLSAEKKSFFITPDGSYQQPSALKIFRHAFSGRRYAIYFPRAAVKKRNSAMRGSSWSCTRRDFLRVNGFDEKFCEVGYGYEDIDISHRLNRAGVECYVPKFRVIYYHFGPAGIGSGKSEAVRKNKGLLDANDGNEVIHCEIGVNAWIGKVSEIWCSD